jgi:hypothetical protein
MRATILLLAFVGQYHHAGLGMPPDREPPHTAAMEPNPQYPLKVRVLSSDRTHDRYGTKSYGSGNLLQEPMVGFDYSSDCSGGFMHNGAQGEYYQGRWKKQDRKIEILTAETGSTHVDKCDIDITEKPKPYGPGNPPPRLVTAH